jgi:hypothetical protein
MEVLVGASIMLLIVLATLSLYTRSNKISADQQQFAELQHDVRSGMFFISRDIRNTGFGLVTDISGYSLEGIDGHGPSPESSDSIKLVGNFDFPLNLSIKNYMAGAGGGAATAFLYNWELENNPFDSADDYEDKSVLLISTKCPGCFAFRYVPTNGLIGFKGPNPQINLPPGLSELNPPGGLLDTGCSTDCWEDAKITFMQIKKYWLDTTGNPGDYPDLSPTVGQDGYLGIPYTLYLTTLGEGGGITHMPLALNIENLQFQYGGDLDNDGFSDGLADWDNTNWTINPGDDEATKQTKLGIIRRIGLVRIWVLGRTENVYVSISGTPSRNLYLYRRPAIANSPQSNQDDKHRRFLLESASNIKNHSLDLYNTGK